MEYGDFAIQTTFQSVTHFPKSVIKKHVINYLPKVQVYVN